MCSGYLSYAQLKKYIAIGLDAGLIHENGEGKYYTTPRGIEYLRRFEELKSAEKSAAEKRSLLEDILNQNLRSFPTRLAK